MKCVVQLQEGRTVLVEKETGVVIADGNLVVDFEPPLAGTPFSMGVRFEGMRRGKVS